VIYQGVIVITRQFYFLVIGTVLGIFLFLILFRYQLNCNYYMFLIGNLPDLTFMVEPSTSTLSISVSEKKRGVSGKGKAYIEIDGVISPGISPGATANEVSFIESLNIFKSPKQMQT
jgi:hypothetical protein